MLRRIDSALVSEKNEELYKDLKSDYDALGEKLSRDGIDIENFTKAAEQFQIAVPSWGTATGGTRFARFPLKGEPRNIYEKLEDCSVINELSGCTDSVSPVCFDRFPPVLQPFENLHCHQPRYLTPSPHASHP